MKKTLTFTALLAAAALFADDADILDYVDAQVGAAREDLEGQIAAAAPADYEIVSNKAMTALQSFTETDPTVPSWAKSQTQPLPPDYSTISNKAKNAIQTIELGGQTLPRDWMSHDKVSIPVTEPSPDVGLIGTPADAYYTYIALLGKANSSDIPLAVSNAVPAWALAAQKPTYTASEVGAATTSALDEVGDLATGNMERLASLNLQLSDGYDMFLSVAGDDANDGLTRLSPKRTIQGCYDAASDGTTVCVLPGDYTPPANTNLVSSNPQHYDRYFITSYGRSLTFVAEDGPEKTFITGQVTSTNFFANGFNHTLAFWDGPQTFKGFTLRGLSAWRKYGNYQDGAGLSAPMLAALRLEDCVVSNCVTRFSLSWGLVNECDIVNTRFSGISATSSRNTNVSSAFVESKLSNCRIEFDLLANDEIGSSNANGSGRLFDGCSVAKSLVKIDALSGNFRGDRSSSFDQSTFIWDPAENYFYSDAPLVGPKNSVNCYFVVTNGFDAAKGSGNAAAGTNAFLTADYVPLSIECPAVRDDGRKDAGWRDSGLGPEKTAAALASAVAANRGEIAALSNETAFALADLRDYTDGQLQNCYQQSVGYTDQMASNALALVMLEAATLRDEIAALTNGVPAVAALTASNTVDALLTPSPLTVEYGNDVTNSFVLAKDWVTQTVVFDRVDGESGPVMNTRCSLYSAGRLRNYSIMIDEIPEDTLGECVNMSFVDLTNAVPRVYASPAFYDFNIDGMIYGTPCYGWLITTNDIPCVISFRQPEESICIVTREKLEN